MASNKELIEQIDALAEELGETVETKDLNNADLATLAKSLREKKANAGAEDAANAKSEAAAAKAKEAEDAKKPDFYVKEGKSVTSKRGIRADGDEVTAKDFEGGKDVLDSLIKRGIVIKS